MVLNLSATFFVLLSPLWEKEITEKKMKYLIAMDLEGIHGVVGEPYSGLLKTIDDYKIAVECAEKEVNIATSALFDSGAELVAVWDNHGGGGNIDFDKIDKRVIKINARADKRRFDFVREYGFDGIVYLGYHAREGTLGAVLAHTYSSVAIQYVKIDGVAVGELDIDTYIAATYGIAPIFAASDDICISQFDALAPDAVKVVTKIAKGRNAAEFKDEDTVLSEIYNGITEALKKPMAVISYPTPASVEIRYTRMEFAAEMLKKAKELGLDAVYGEDAHIIKFTLNEINLLPSLL